MDSKLEDKLMKDFDFMEHKNPDGTPSGRSVYCGVEDGWFHLIYNLCTELKELYDSQGVPTNLIHVLQVKEKWGGLRFYVGDTIDGGQEIISKYEDLSFNIGDTE